MFTNLTERLTTTIKNLSGRGNITESNIQESLQEVRKALLEADVALPVVTDFIERVKNDAIGSRVLETLNPGQMFIKIVHTALIQLMGEHNDRLHLNAAPPAIVLMAGLQGAGKTTSVAKLAKWLKDREKKTVMVVSADIYRPAAIQQLQTLAAQVQCQFFESSSEQTPLEIVKAAQEKARKAGVDVLIVDTAGRLHVDDDMMAEIKQLHAVLNPIETLFVVDAMTGQDAVNTAKAFNEVLPLTGVILTKADGDARGGAALSVRAITGKPIKFLGMGEKTDALQPFYPDRMASRILGMGDVLTLVEEAERNLDKKKISRLTKKIIKGNGFDFEDMLEQFKQLQKMGGMMGVLDKLPGMGQFTRSIESVDHQGMIKHTEAMIHSMTLHERRFPDIISPSRKKRIASGSGRDISDVNRLIKQHKQMQKMVKKFSKKGGLKSMQRSLGSMMGNGGPAQG